MGELSCPNAPWEGYLKADPALAREWTEWLPRYGKRIGVCWSSGIRKGIWLGEYGRIMRFT